MTEAQSQRNDNFISDLWSSWEDAVRKYIGSDKEDQELLDELVLFVEINWTCF